MRTEKQNEKLSLTPEIYLAIILIIISFFMATYSTIDYIAIVLKENYKIVINLPVSHIFEHTNPLVGAYFFFNWVIWYLTYLIFSIGFGQLLVLLTGPKANNANSVKKLLLKSPLAVVPISFVLITVIIPFFVQVQVADIYGDIFTLDIYGDIFTLTIIISSLVYVLFLLEFNVASYLFFKSKSNPKKQLIILLISIAIFPLTFIFSALLLLFLSGGGTY